MLHRRHQTYPFGPIVCYINIYKYYFQRALALQIMLLTICKIPTLKYVLFIALLK